MSELDAPADRAEVPAADELPGARRRGGLAGRIAIDTRPLAIPTYRRLMIGNGTSFIGSMLTQVAVPVQVYAISKSSLQVGLVGLAGLIPIVGFGLYGGAIADAVDRRKLYILASTLSWLVTLGLLVQTLVGARSVPLILGLVFVQNASFATSSSARGAIVPRLVPTDLVAAANTLSFTVSNIGQVVGPLLAGLLVDRRHGFAWAYAVDACLFTALLYSGLRLPPLPPTTPMGRPGLASVFEGLRFIGTSPVLIMSFLVDIAAMVLAMPRALFPEAAADRFHGGVGPLYSAIAIGSVIAGLGSGWISRVRRQGVALTCAVVIWCASITVAGFAHRLWLAVLLLAVAGGADLVSAVYRQTMLQTYAPDEMRGRMQGVFVAVVAGGPRLGDVRAGAMASVASLTVAWSGSAIACAAIVLVAAISVRPFWHYEPAST